MSKEMVIKLKEIENIKESNALVKKIVKNATNETKEELLKEFKEYINGCKIKNLSENRNYFYAIQFLLMFNELKLKEAFDLIIEFLQIDENAVASELGNALDKILYKIIANLGDNKENELKVLIKNKKLHWEIRRIFSLALANMTYAGKVSYEETSEFYKTIMMDKNLEIEVRYCAAYDANGLELSELSDLIKKTDMESSNLPPWEYEEKPDFEEEISKKFRDVFEEEISLIKFLNFYEMADEVLDSTLGGKFGMDKNEKDDSIYDLSKTEPRNTMKIGRNDPCFCGSGKKYKKCCGK